MDDTQRIVKCGNLSLHTAGGFFKKRWHNKYLVLYDGSKSGVKRLELFDSEIKFKKQNPEKIIPLVDCVRIVTCQRHKSTYTFEVRTSDQFYLLAAQSFQAMNDWVNCLRLVAFGQQVATTTSLQPAALNGSQQQQQQQQQAAACTSSQASGRPPATGAASELASAGPSKQPAVDILLDRRQPPGKAVAVASSSTPTTSAGGVVITASQAAAAAASALAKTRQRQPSLLGSCKPQPPGDSPFIAGDSAAPYVAPSQGPGAAGGPLGALLLNSIGQLDTMTPTVRGQLLSTKNGLASSSVASATATNKCRPGADPTDSTKAIIGYAKSAQPNQPPKGMAVLKKVDEEEENMLYCSIEDNPSEHNYRVKVIETELALRCQLKCYQLTAPTLISEQYEELAQFRHQISCATSNGLIKHQQNLPHIVTFYQLIIGPQELTLLNDYATSAVASSSPVGKQQGLWSWPYQCIRRYGFDKDNCFMFEAGRKCTSGPGQFIVQTPKAYNIYQDVVKFVNELRTISSVTPSAGVLNQLAPPGAQGGQHQVPEHTEQVKGNIDVGQREAKQLVITQIPVVWAPNEQSSAGQAASAGAGEPPTDDRRRHFFDALRQSSHSGSAQSCSQTQIATTTLPKNHNQSASMQQLAAKNCASSQQDATSERYLGGLASDNGHELSRMLENSSSSAVNHLDRIRHGQLLSATVGVETDDATGDGCGQLKNYTPAMATDNPLRQKRDLKNQGVSLSNGKPFEQMDTNLKRASVATISQSDHDTDESGYEHGDESVDSCSASLATKGLAKTSNISKSNCVAGSSRKRQLTMDSMSSASSTSSEALTTSPSQSVSRGSTGGFGPRLSVSSAGSSSKSVNSTNGASSQNQAKRPPLIKSIRQAGGEQNKSGHRKEIKDYPVDRSGGLLNGSVKPNLDFEANLIRDVYSEISKLHAKFAVTTSGSADDSMSSGSSSSRDSASSDQLEKDSEDLDEAVNVDRRLGDRINHGEPMYSNIDSKPMNRGGTRSGEQDRLISSNHQMGSNSIGCSGHLTSASSRLNVNNRCNLQHGPMNGHHQKPTQNGQEPNRELANNNCINNNVIARSACLDMNYLSSLNAKSASSSLISRQMYPIPECGELMHSTQAPPVAPKPQNFFLNNIPSNNCNSTRITSSGLTLNEQPGEIENGLPRVRLSGNRVDMKRGDYTNPVNSNSNYRRHQTSSSNRSEPEIGKVKPTNHYVINDVQYAKISRNLRY